MEIPECEHREPLPKGAKYNPDVPEEQRTMVCCVMRDVLGWRHGMPMGHCVRCQADPDNPKSVKAVCNVSIIKRMLRLRISQFFGWDDDEPKKKRTTKDVGQVIETAKEWLGEDEAAQALVDATRNGLPLEKATELARKYFSK